MFTALGLVKGAWRNARWRTGTLPGAFTTAA